jgi:hypothetical protein
VAGGAALNPSTLPTTATLVKLNPDGTLSPASESGTFTPSLKGDTTAGEFTYYNQYGQYTKIGNIIIVRIRIAIEEIRTPAAGNLMLVGLPKGDANAAITITQISGKIAGANFIGNVSTIQGAIYASNVTSNIDASTLKVHDGFTCTLVYPC